jgi:hypothetical protein
MNLAEYLRVDSHVHAFVTSLNVTKFEHSLSDLLLRSR